MANVRKTFPIAWAQVPTLGPNDDPGDVKIAGGWEDEIPPAEQENFLQNKITEMLGHIEIYGMAVWDTATIYTVTSYCLGSDGIIYKSLQAANQGHNPLASPSWWTKAFIDRTSAETIAGAKTFNALLLGADMVANNHKVTGLATPTSNQDAANKTYVDAKVFAASVLDTETAVGSQPSEYTKTPTRGGILNVYMHNTAATYTAIVTVTVNGVEMGVLTLSGGQKGQMSFGVSGGETITVSYSDSGTGSRITRYQFIEK